MKRMISCFIIVLVIVSFGIVFGTSANLDTPLPPHLQKNGVIAYEHMEVLANDIGPRIAGSKNERMAEKYIIRQFKRMGLNTEIQKFSYTRRGSTYASSNVIALKEGLSSKQVIVGAHYDSVAEGHGVDDNASGVGVMLEVAELLKDINTPYSIVFIAFGAEETSLQGSHYYVNEMSEKEIANTVGMINLDSLAVGDKLYVYGDEGEDGFIRDQILEIAKKKNLNVETNPGTNPELPRGTTGDWSDHAPFKDKGIPHGYFEATNWEIGEMDGYGQTEEHGQIWHTSRDTFTFINEEYPGRIQEHLATFSILLTEVLKYMNHTSTNTLE